MLCVEWVGGVTQQATDADILAAYADEIRSATPCNWEVVLPEEQCQESAAWMVRMRHLYCMGGVLMPHKLAAQTVYFCEDHQSRLLTARLSPSQVLRCTGCRQVAPLSHLAVSWERISRG